MINQALFNILLEAYNTGMLQYDDLSILGINFHMDMKSRMNVLTATTTKDGHKTTVSINVYDNDSQALQEYSIEMLLKGILS